MKQIWIDKYFKAPVLLSQEARNGFREDRIFSFLVFLFSSISSIGVSLGSVQ